jgi:hypothetical protein
LVGCGDFGSALAKSAARRVSKYPATSTMMIKVTTPSSVVTYAISAGALPHSELVTRDVGEGGRRLAGAQNPAIKPTKRPESEIRGLPYGLLPDLPGSGVASMD